MAADNPPLLGVYREARRPTPPLTPFDYSVCTVRQVSPRSWRIGQTRPAKVVFMSNRNTLQGDALKLGAKNLQTSRDVEGELPEDGLAAYGDGGDNLMLPLARMIVSGEENEAESVEEAFAEEYPVDAGWKLVEMEPESVASNGNRANDSGDHDAIGPTVELALSNGHLPVNGTGNGHAPAPVNRNGHHNESPEPQRTLFSRAEFMAEEPVKLKVRSRKPQPATASLFEGVSTLEQEWEAEPVGAGR